MVLHKKHSIKVSFKKHTIKFSEILSAFSPISTVLKLTV